MDREWLSQRIANTKLIIEEYETAILQLQSGAVQSYTLNTQQTTQTVSRFDVSRLSAQLPGLYNQLTTLQARLSGCNVLTAGPAW